MHRKNFFHFPSSTKNCNALPHFVSSLGRCIYSLYCLCWKQHRKIAGDVCVTLQRNLFNKQPVLSWIFLLNIIYEFLLLQVRNPTSALGRAVNGVLQGAMSLHVIIANTQEPNPSSAAIVIAASHVLIIWPCTWNDTCEVKFKSKKGLKMNCVPLRAIKCRGRSSQLV